MKSISAVRSLVTAVLLCLSLWLVMALLVEHLYRIERERAHEAQRAEILTNASATRARVEAELNATIYVSSGLVAYVTAYDDLLEDDRVMTALAALYRNGRHIRNVALAPANVLRYTYPLEGNESTIGLDYRDTPDQWPGVQRAMEERRTVLAGPLELVQGGQALIARTPVFLDRERYWGLLSLVIDTASLFAAAGLDDAASDIRYALRREHPGVNGMARVFGPESVFDADPVVLEIPVPGNAWLLAAAPNAGWDGQQPYLGVYRYGGHALVLLVAMLVFMVLEERNRIARMALHDPLTRLPNRRSLSRRFNEAMRRAERDGRALGLLYIDLNGFKAVNDHFGHGKGDAVLTELSSRMAAAIRREDFIARIGGDEFAVLLADAATRADAEARVRPLRDAVRRPLDDLDLPQPLDASIGIAMYPEDGSDLHALLQAADQKMYAGKRGQEGGAVGSSA